MPWPTTYDRIVHHLWQYLICRLLFAFRICGRYILDMGRYESMYGQRVLTKRCRVLLFGHYYVLRCRRKPQPRSVRTFVENSLAKKYQRLCNCAATLSFCSRLLLNFLRSTPCRAVARGSRLARQTMEKSVAVSTSQHNNAA